MGMSVQGIESIEDLLFEIDSDTKRRAVKELIAGAHLMQETAKAMAPVDKGSLEHAIKVDVTAARDELGRFARRTVTVFIDMNEPCAENPMKLVGEYAFFVHEMVAPYGPYSLGPKSKIKQAASPFLVGGGFMERAAEQTQAAIVQGVLKGVREYFGG